MKKLFGLMLATLLVGSLFVNAQTPALEAGKQYGIKGTMQIDFASRKNLDAEGKPEIGRKDVYTLDIDIAETLHFGGKVEALPGIYSSIGLEKQLGQVYYSIDLGIRNPANLAATPMAVGRFVGAAPVDNRGIYQYDRGTARIAVDARGQSQGFESKFQGTAQGRAPSGAISLKDKWAAAKLKAVTLKKQVQGKQVAIVVSKFDKMNWDATLPAGPVKLYPDTRVTGEMLFDYERSAWYFTGMTMTYQLSGKTITDRLSGNIKWVQSPSYKSTGEGEYQFDIRVNEPEGTSAGEAAVFAAADEAAFFASDAAIPSLQGTMKYKDTISGGETVVGSRVDINLTGNQLSKQQVVALGKLVVFAAIVPMNSD